MKPQSDHNNPSTESAVEETTWRPEVLDGAIEEHELPSDFDLDEVWHWFHSRLKALGHLSHDDARLTALLNWNDITVGEALRTARLHVNQVDEEGEVRQAHLEYLTAEYLARQVLEKESIPAPELHPA
jgi:hypothetical protein